MLVFGLFVYTLYISIYCVVELREDNVETLLATACLMQLGAVTEACCGFLAHQLHPSNCLGIAVFADQQGCVNLLTEATAYTSQHFMQVFHSHHMLLCVLSSRYRL